VEEGMGGGGGSVRGAEDELEVERVFEETLASHAEAGGDHAGVEDL